MHDTPSLPLTLEGVRAAAARLAPHVFRTAMVFNEGLSRAAGAKVWIKHENLQRTGSFKVRGSTNKVLALLAGPQPPPGVVAASAGNHAQGVAYAARAAGLRACVVMPMGASLTKLRACQELGAEVVQAGATLEEAAERASAIGAERGFAMVHPYDDWQVIEGQATCGLEIAEELPEVTHVIVPLGGGGLLAGVAFAVKALAPRARLIGVQTEAVAPWRGFLKSGEIGAVPRDAFTIADGIRVKAPGRRNMAVVRQCVDEIVTVDDDAIAEAIVALLERTRTIGEGAGVVGLAALLKHRLDLGAADRVALVVSGGNIDMTLVGRSIDFGLVSSGRLLAIAITVPDTPGQLAQLLRSVAELGMNIRQIEHRRGEVHVPVGRTEVVLQVETRDWAHQRALFARLAAEGLAARALGETEG